VNFCKIISTDIGIINEIYAVYTRSFPEDERRDEKQFYALFQNPKVQVFLVVFEHNAIAYLITWQLEEFVFIEHFEVFETYRNMKYGALILNQFSEKFSKIILESEPEIMGELAIRRLGFYGRNGFSIVERNYEQPPYSKEKNALKLYLLSNFKIDAIAPIVLEIYKVVYQKNFNYLY